jgi:hypothetical protein
MQTRRQIEEDWAAVSDLLMRQDQPELAAHVRQFVRRMARARTEREHLAGQLAVRSQDHKIRSEERTR